MITLVGLPGVGKTTIGKQLARGLGFTLVDSDAEVERRIGSPIRDFFERVGEEQFRDIEQAVIAELVSRTNAVLATGGGVVLRETNRLALQNGSTVVYLRAKPEDLFHRLRHDTRRPLLQGHDPRCALRNLYVKRDRLYRQTAHFVIETGRLSAAMLVNMILAQLELAGVVDPFRTSLTVGLGRRSG